VIALMGMIMRNSVILIDQIEQDRARGVPPGRHRRAAVRRFRPIVLTAAAAVLAMIPLSRSVFWGPMAVAIMGGLVVATALTLAGLAGDVRRLVPGETLGKEKRQMMEIPGRLQRKIQTFRTPKPQSQFLQVHLLTRIQMRARDRRTVR
jgi:hypothetical protein